MLYKQDRSSPASLNPLEHFRDAEKEKGVLDTEKKK
jgi:hypothetical protein